MATRYRYDLYPRTDPRDGDRLVRFTKLQKALFRSVIGVGSGAGVIRSTQAEAAFLDPRGEQYVRIVREDTVAATEQVVAGFWINRFNHDTAVRKQTKRLTFSGAETMAYLARARNAPHSYLHEAVGAIGSDPYDDTWRYFEQGTALAAGDFLGSALWRVILEALHYRTGATYTHRHKDGLVYTDAHDDDRTGGSAIALVTLGFDGFEDSDGNPWTLPSGEFQAPVGENVLATVQRLMQAGLYVEMDPDTFELRAWEANDHRRDRTGGSWGASVVRFQRPTDGTVATGNMLSESVREINSHLKRTTVWAGGQDVYGKATGSSDILWEGFEHSQAEDVDAHEQLASAQITAREEASDAGSIRMKLGAVPASGRYRPWEEVKLDDLVTVHTGTGEWDYEEAEYPVAGLKIELQPSGAWHAWAELGASFGGGHERGFQVQPVASHSHGPNPLLCDPTIPGTDATQIYDIDFDSGAGTNGAHIINPIYPSGSGTWPTDTDNIALTDGLGGSHAVFWNSSSGAGAGSPSLPATAGVQYLFSAWAWTDSVGADVLFVRFYDGGGNTLATHTLAEDVPNVWTHYTGAFTAPPGTVSMRLLPGQPLAAWMGYDEVQISTAGVDAQNPYAGTSPRAARCDHSHAGDDHEHDEYALAEHTHDPGSGGGSGATGIYHPVMAQDPADNRYYVVVSGDGTAVMALNSG